MVDMCEGYDENGETIPLTVLGYVKGELNEDNIIFTNSKYLKVYEAVCGEGISSYEEDY